MTMSLSSYLFWDVDQQNIDFDVHSQFIISRVLMKGTLADWQWIKKYYGKEFIKNEVVKIKYLDNLTLNFCSSYFNIPKSDFKCSNTKQSIRAHWNY